MRAKELYERAAKAGNCDALVNLGHLCRDGADGVPKNASRARDMYQRAVDLGHVDSMVDLGTMYESGADGVPKNALRAKGLFAQASESGSALGMLKLANLFLKGGEGVEKDPLRAKTMLKRAVKAGNTDAMPVLCALLVNGDVGIPKDTAEAKRLYEHAVDVGHMERLPVCEISSLLERATCPKMNRLPKSDGYQRIKATVRSEEARFGGGFGEVQVSDVQALIIVQGSCLLPTGRAHFHAKSIQTHCLRSVHNAAQILFLCALERWENVARNSFHVFFVGWYQLVQVISEELFCHPMQFFSIANLHPRHQQLRSRSLSTFNFFLLSCGIVCSGFPRARLSVKTLPVPSQHVISP